MSVAQSSMCLDVSICLFQIRPIDVYMLSGVVNSWLRSQENFATGEDLCSQSALALNF